ncbi:MAG: rhomboid family intramembrane serine protease [Campylobacterota bacterium]|nr:rhomboid family intramembrane serine protease [Campylobacterota bacterium]
MPTDFKRFRITYSLIGLNLLFYAASILYTGSVVDMPAGGLVDLGAIYGPYVVGGEWWRLLTAMFLHGGMTHLLMNMFSLYIIGRPMELYFSTKSYLSLYFLTGIVGGLVSISVHPETVSIGASGAIFGVFGALSGYFFAYRRELGEQAQQFMKDFALIIGINLVIGFTIPNIDVSAHAGGLVSGLIGGLIVARHPERLWVFVVGILLAIASYGFYLTTLHAQVIF